jgi:hypothetical protein
MDTMRRALEFSGLLLLKPVCGTRRTAMLDTTIGKMLPAHSPGAVLWREWILTIACGGLIGFGMKRTRISHAAMWTWVLSALWFGIPVSIAILHGDAWILYSGAGCVVEMPSLECEFFFLVTVRLIRGVSYSLGPCVLVGSRKPQPFCVDHAITVVTAVSLAVVCTSGSFGQALGRTNRTAREHDSNPFPS